MISSAALQWIAVIAMTIDHVGLYLCGDFWPMRVIGRLAMPIFCLLLVEGFCHTRSRSRYLARLLIFAFAALIPHLTLAVLTHVSFSLNVLFTLALSLLALVCVEKGRWCLLGLIPIFALVIFFPFEYGIFAVLAVIGLYYARKLFSHNRAFLILAQLLVLAAMNISLYLQAGWLLQLWAIAAIVPIALYSGEKGHRMGGRFFYYYYPLHLFAILIIKLLFY